LPRGCKWSGRFVGKLTAGSGAVRPQDGAKKAKTANRGKSEGANGGEIFLAGGAASASPEKSLAVSSEASQPGEGDGAMVVPAPVPAAPWIEEPDELDVGEAEMEYEEPEEVKKIREVRAPTDEQRRQHLLENHAVYRDWCQVCIASRATGTQHRRAKKQQAEKEQEGARICSDYYFMSTDESSMPMVALKNSRSGRIGATALEQKGVTEFGVKFCARFMQQTGLRKFVNFSDGEPAMKALKEAAAQSVTTLETIPREVPQGDHQKNGEIESAVRELKRQMRAIRMQLEQNLGRQLANDDPILSWIPTFAADTMAMYRRGRDGKTAYERETGRKWAKPALEFGEKVFIKEAKERGPGAKKRDWESRLIPVRYVGHHARTGAVMGLTEDGVKVGSGIKRVAVEDRWTLDGWDSLRGLPWCTRPAQRAAPLPAIGPGEPVPLALPPITLPTVRRETRSFYVLKADIEKFGQTPGCPGCIAISKGQSNRGHNAECRKRVMEEVRKVDPARIGQFEEKQIATGLVADIIREHEERQVQTEPEKKDASVGASGESSSGRDPMLEVAVRAAVDESERKRKPDGDAGSPATPRRQKKGRDETETSPDFSGEVARDTPARKNVWSKVGEGRYEKRKAEVPAEELDEARRGTVEDNFSGEGGQGETARKIQGAAEELPSRGGAASSSSSQEPPVAPSVLVLPAEVPRSNTADIEDAVMVEGDEVRRASDSRAVLSSLELGVSAGVSMSSSKADMIERAIPGVQELYRRQRVDVSLREARDIAAMQVELGSVDILEIYSPQRFTGVASKLGLRPGFAVDLTEAKPYGPDKGQPWDLLRQEDVEELDRMVDREKPALLIGSPPGDPVSQLLNLTAKKTNKAKNEEEKAKGVQNLRTAIRFYQKQHEANRYFLHEHPAGASSWNDEELIHLQQQPCMYTIDGPMCRWEMETEKHRSGKGHVFRRAKWVTNSKVLAEILEVWSANQAGEPFYRQANLVGGLAAGAAAYPPKLVMAILKGLKQQLLLDGVLSNLELQTSGPVPSEPLFDPSAEWAQDEKFWDDITGEELPTELVRSARQVEIGWVHDINLYDKVPRSEARAKGIKPITVRWVDVNKGDRRKYNIRCRLVGRELKAKTREALLAHELFSAMPPWEAIKALMSLLVSDGLETENDEELELGIFDISRAHFMPKAKRELYIEIPAEDLSPEDGDVVGRLNRNMYGFRDASSGWQEDWQELLRSEGYDVGTANPALFLNSARHSRGAVHGDDFYVLAGRSALDHMKQALESKYSVRESHRLGFGEHCVQQATVLNRVVTLGRDEQGRKFLQIEPDARHVELILKSLGLGDGAKSVTTPGVKHTEAEVSRRQQEPPLDKAKASEYRSNVMRASFLSQDRPDLAESVKSLAQFMSKPTEGSWSDLKHFGRYLLGKPSEALVYKQQTLPSSLRVWVDSDHAGNRFNRRSTTGMVQRLGMHTLKSTSNLQTAIGLNVAESEYYALVHGAANGLGLQAFLKDLGLNMSLELYSDSSSARAFTSRRGLGKQRHVETRFLWLQDRVARKHLTVHKVGTHANIADILTKCVNGPLLARHVREIGLCTVPRSSLHKTVSD
jgi:hypothetical protein